MRASRKYLNRFLHNHRLVIGEFGSGKMLFEKGICSFQVFDTEDFQIIEEATLLRILGVRSIASTCGKWAIGSVDDLGELLKTCDDPISTDTVVWAIRRVTTGQFLSQRTGGS